MCCSNFTQNIEVEAGGFTKTATICTEPLFIMDGCDGNPPSTMCLPDKPRDECNDPSSSQPVKPHSSRKPLMPLSPNNILESNEKDPLPFSTKMEVQQLPIPYNYTLPQDALPRKLRDQLKNRMALDQSQRSTLLQAIYDDVTGTYHRL